MIKDLAYASVLAASTSFGAVAMEWPDLLTRWVLILSGAVFGTLAAALKFPAQDRGSRAFFSLLTGPIIAMVVLWLTPKHAAADSREWIIVISFVAALLAWPISEWIKRRRPVESALDAFADRFGVKTNKRRADNDQGGRVRPVVLVLLAGLAALAWICRDIIFLIYMMLTGGFGH